MRNWTADGNPGWGTERGQARAQMLLLVVVCFALGLTVGAVWLSRQPGRATPPAEGAAPALSASTRAVLDRLEAPVEFRYYRLLDPASVPADVESFAGRIDALLAEYARAAAGKVKLTRHDSLSDANAKAALADGVAAFNRERGDACFLGIALECQGRKEVLSRLSPEWESAVEPDLTRALARLASGTPGAPAAAAEADPAVFEEVKRLVPNYASVSADEGTRTLHEAALAEFKTAAAELAEKVKQAEERLTQARNGDSPAAQQAAVRELTQLKAQQLEEFKRIMSRSELRVRALRELKAQKE